jgi:hypothetical protein
VNICYLHKPSVAQILSDTVMFIEKVVRTVDFL